MRENPVLKKVILEVVDKQLKSNEPPETRQTLERLKSEGFSDKEARKFIGTVVASEIIEVLQNQEVFKLERFIERLDELPG